MEAKTDFRIPLQRGLVIPAHPLALTGQRTLDERRQRALSRYYLAAGAGGLAVGVHTTQFAIRDPRVGLFEPVLALAAEEMGRADVGREEPVVRIGGICGATMQAVREAELLRQYGYHAGLLSLAALKEADNDALIAHCRAVAAVVPLVGFYLQPAVGGRVLPYAFWRRFAEIEQVVAIKIAPFNRYQTLDVVRAVVDAGREDIALYTGNDDNILLDLLTPFALVGDGRDNRDRTQGGALKQSISSVGSKTERRIVGGLLGHWAVWTRQAVTLLKLCHEVHQLGAAQAGLATLDPQSFHANLAPYLGLLRQGILPLAAQVTDSNAAFFDAAHGFRGCIAGLHEVLRRQGLLEGLWCLDPHEDLSPGQAEEIDRVYAAYPHLNDDDFVAEHRDEWLR
ncbi:MAG: dihydrodipicolinate synthase family protein [Candidatus Hydrogenedentes bacterium]|nr:dihydrodipicolinate synthase family protein [Candidatus Hydrogenedentota bacterium]